MKTSPNFFRDISPKALTVKYLFFALTPTVATYLAVSVGSVLGIGSLIEGLGSLIMWIAFFIFLHAAWRAQRAWLQKTLPGGVISLFVRIVAILVTAILTLISAVIISGLLVFIPASMG